MELPKGYDRIVIEPKPITNGQRLAAGNRIEDRLARELCPLGWIRHGQRYYTEVRGKRKGFEVDFYKEFDDFVIVVECKRTLTINAFRKLRDIYLPLVARRHKKPAYGFQIAKCVHRYGGNIGTETTLEAFVRKPHRENPYEIREWL